MLVEIADRYVCQKCNTLYTVTTPCHCGDSHRVDGGLIRLAQKARGNSEAEREMMHAALRTNAPSLAALKDDLDAAFGPKSIGDIDLDDEVKVALIACRDEDGARELCRLLIRKGYGPQRETEVLDAAANLIQVLGPPLVPEVHEDVLRDLAYKLDLISERIEKGASRRGFEELELTSDLRKLGLLEEDDG